MAAKLLIDQRGWTVLRRFVKPHRFTRGADGWVGFPFWFTECDLGHDGVCVPRWERDHWSIAQDRLFFLLTWARPVNKVNQLGTKNGRVQHWPWAEDYPKSEGSPYWRRSAVRDAYLLLRERGKGRLLGCFQAGPAARNQEIFAGADMELRWRKKAPRRDEQSRSKLGSRR